MLATESGVQVQAPGSPTPQNTSFVGSADAIAVQCVGIQPSDPSVWLAGTGLGVPEGGIFKLTCVGGASTLVCQTRKLGSAVLDIEQAGDSSKVVLATNRSLSAESGVLRCSNDGTNSQPVVGAEGWAIRYLEIDPLQPKRGIAMTAFGSQSVSNDYGENWSPPTIHVPFLGTVELLVASVHREGHLYLSESGAGFWRSDDFGATWAPLTGTGLGEKALVESPNVPDVIWAVDSLNRFFVSGDAGSSWGQPNASFANSSLNDLGFDPATGTILFATSSGLFEESGTVIGLGGPTEGSAGFRPRIFFDGLLGPGNAGFAFRGDRLLGGAPVFQVISMSEVSLPNFGGTLHVGGPFALQFLTLANGPTGSPGKGSFSRSAPVPANPALTGATFVSQFLVGDAGAADPSGFAVSGGVRLVGQP